MQVLIQDLRNAWVKDFLNNSEWPVSVSKVLIND